MAPGKLHEMRAVASTTNILSFADTGKRIDEAKKRIKQGESTQTVLTEMGSFASIQPIANCLTATHSDFANFLHKDRDYAPLAYGWWWAAKRESEHSRSMWLDPSVDHKNVKGGAFYWPGFGIAVDFER
jgi:hypothetical protein